MTSAGTEIRTFSAFCAASPSHQSFILELDGTPNTAFVSSKAPRTCIIPPLQQLLLTKIKNSAYVSSTDPEDAYISGLAECHNVRTTIPLDLSTHGNLLPLATEDLRVEVEIVRDNNFPSEEALENELMAVEPLTPLRGFAVHTRCWDILGEFDHRFTSNFRFSSTMMRALHDVCNDQRMREGVMEWMHGNCTFVCSVSTTPTYDPRDHIPALHPESFDDEYEDNQEPVTASGADVFQGLPSEILTEVCLFLPPESFAQLRLASRTVARLPIPAAFWRSFFHRGGWFEYLGPLVSPEVTGENWRRCFLMALSIEEHPAVLNRKRIWLISSLVTGLVDRQLLVNFQETDLDGDEEING